MTLIKKAIATHQSGDIAEAERLYRKILADDKRNFDALHLLGIICAQKEKFDEAERLLRAAIAVDPRFPPCYHNYGNVLAKLKRYQDAIDSYDRAIALAPNHAPAYSDRGNCEHELKRFDAALNSYAKALSYRPDHVAAWSGRGNVLYDIGRYGEAAAAFDKALSLKPDHPGAWVGRGNLLYKLKRYDDAAAAYQRALAVSPNLAEAWFGRGNVLLNLKRYGEAIAAYDRTLSINPDQPYAEGTRIECKLHLCDWTNFDADCAHLIVSLGRGVVATSPFLLLAIDATPAEQLACARAYSAKAASTAVVPAWTGTRYKHDKIRLAYLSADFREHPVSYLLAGVIERHDRNRFETVAVSFGPDAPNDMLARLKGTFGQFIDVRERSDGDVAKLMKEIEIDIAIDLMGYTHEARSEILAYRPAPVQVSYLGYAGTSGTDYVDYLIADPTVIPERDRPSYAEKIVYLPDSYMPTDPARPIAQRAFTRGEFGLPQDGVVFCCFNNNFKFNPHLFDAWMNIMRRVPGSVLWLSEVNAPAAANLKKEAEARSVEAGRIVFASRMPDIADHLARQRLADLFLDSSPYNAHASASDALLAGLPVLTRAGETFAGRVAASLLNASGMPELITASPDDYVETAVGLALNPDKLALIRQKLAANRPTTPMFDIVRYTRHLEAAFTAMHERHQAGLAADHIHVPPS